MFSLRSVVSFAVSSTAIVVNAAMRAGDFGTAGIIDYDDHEYPQCKFEFTLTNYYFATRMCCVKIYNPENSKIHFAEWFIRPVKVYHNGTRVRETTLGQELKNRV